jgi:hypothetical protein
MSISPKNTASVSFSGLVIAPKPGTAFNSYERLTADQLYIKFTNQPLQHADGTIGDLADVYLPGDALKPASIDIQTGKLSRWLAEPTLRFALEQGWMKADPQRVAKAAVEAIPTGSGFSKALKATVLQAIESRPAAKAQPVPDTKSWELTLEKPQLKPAD